MLTIVCLTAHSVMNIKLAAQILSYPVENVLKEFGPPEASGIAEFCVVKDEFFNCFNVQRGV